MTRSLARRTLASCLLLFLALGPAGASALEVKEWGLSAFVHNDLDIKGGNLEGLGASLALAVPLWGGAGWRLDLRLEFEAAGFWNYASGVELALLPGLRVLAPPLGFGGVRPFLEAGLGPAWDRFSIPELGSELNFLSYGGLGLRLPLSGCNLDLGYRLRHISNGGMTEANHGVTSHVLHLGLAWDW